MPRKYQWIALLVASYTFYLFSGIKPVVYIIFTTLVTYGSGRWMQKIRNEFLKQIEELGETATKEQKKAIKREVTARIHRIQVVTILINLSILCYVKYLNYILDGINDIFSLFAWDASVPLVNVIVPLGLSYYTFNSIGYLIDVGRGRLEAEQHVGKFALFLSFFPSIVQGPLFRYEDVGVQLKERHDFKYENLKFGAQLILWGFFKKLVIADRVALISNTIFEPGFDFNGGTVWLGVIAYSFQIYCDFSGGIDITRGAAQMMGINLPHNFLRPFFATSMGDFWQRWHVSLTMWMRNYVFFPVMLSKKVTALSKFVKKHFSNDIGKLVPSVVTPFVVFFLINIWHGLGWQRIINAVYMAGLISASVAFQPLFKKIIAKLHINTEAFSYRVFQMLRTFLLLCISRIMTKAPSLGVAVDMLKAAFTDITEIIKIFFEGGLYKYGLDQQGMHIVIVAILVLLVVGILQEGGMSIRETLSKQNTIFRWVIYALLIFSVLIFGYYGSGYDASSFIYGGY
ncbi:MAG: MBOAT family protein [Firmicutes bacterium]|nr:MBOAT family protein [Bacillota bacterium]